MVRDLPCAGLICERPHRDLTPTSEYVQSFPEVCSLGVNSYPLIFPMERFPFFVVPWVFPSSLVFSPLWFYILS